MTPWQRAEVWLATRPTSRIRPDGDGFLKTRTLLGHLAWGSTAWQAERFLVLPEKRWFQREQILYERFHGKQVETRGPRTIWLPSLPGERLDRAVLALSFPEALEASERALEHLAALHAHPEPDPDGVSERPFSHGDATAKNMLFHREIGTFFLFDFETVHPTKFSLDERRADDLATLAGSLALHLGPASYAPLARVLQRLHGGRLHDALIEAVAARDLASRARVPLRADLHAEWLAAVQTP